MIFTSLTSLALLSGMFLFSNAAPYYTPAPIGPKIHPVNVSNNAAGLLFEPPYILSQPGELIAFTFNIKNHTVTQSTFEEPCKPLQYGTDTNLYVLSSIQHFSLHVFSNMSSYHIAFLLQVGLATTNSPPWYLKLPPYVFPSNTDFSPHDGTN